MLVQWNASRFSGLKRQSVSQPAAKQDKLTFSSKYQKLYAGRYSRVQTSGRFLSIFD
jgi:hypothetical protein